MKRIIFSLFAVTVASLALFVSCDNFADDEILEGIIGETSQTTPITNNRSLQRVLLEDITGWSCTNCPQAAIIAANLTVQYADTLVVMAVHATSFATPRVANNNLDLRTEYGEQWVKDFGVTGCPIGLVNRVKEGNSFLVQPADWAAKVAERRQREHVLDINLGASLNADSTRIIVSTETAFLKAVNMPTLINVVVLESNIVGVQMNGSVRDTAYQFNHVLRTNGRIDFPLTSGTTSAGTTISKNYFIDINTEWKFENCQVVVFITNAETKEVLQVNEIELQ